MSRKIKLPEKFDLCTYGTVHDGNTNKWKGIQIFKELIVRAEASPHQPQYNKFDTLPINKLSEVFLQESSNGVPQNFGRTAVYQGIAIKMQKKSSGLCWPQDEDEKPELLHNEHIMQCILSKDRSLMSAIPSPIGVGYDSKTERHFCAYRIPEGYYTYLSDISSTETFVDSACRAAHDLGYLLRFGYVFQNLISVFHDKYRPYTLLPDITSVGNCSFGGLPGKIVNVIGQLLYENIGQSGLRDLGDLEFITDFRFYDFNSNEMNVPTSLKIAHFISLYLMVFTILIGNRSRKLEENHAGTDHWKANHLIYSQVLQALFRGLNIPLSSEELFYIDPAQRRAQKSNGAQRMMQPSEKFNQQLRVWFTMADFINDEIATTGTESRLQDEVYGSKKASYARVEFGDRPKEYYMKGRYGKEQGRMQYHTRSELWSFSPGCLGQNPSGINPLTTAVKYALRASQRGVEYLYRLSDTDDLRQSSAIGPRFFASQAGDRVISSTEIHGRLRTAYCSVS